MTRPPAVNEAGVRRRILTAASAAFGILGYEGTTVDDIAAQAEVGADEVVRQFGGLRSLFMAVFEEMERDLNGEALEGALAARAEGFAPLLVGARAVVEAITQPGPRQNILIDSRRILTLEEWYGVDRRFGMGSLRGGLRACADQGLIERAHVEPLALVVYGVVTEASLATATGQLNVDLDTLLATIERILLAFTAESAAGGEDGEDAS